MSDKKCKKKPARGLSEQGCVMKKIHIWHCCKHVSSRRLTSLASLQKVRCARSTRRSWRHAWGATTSKGPVCTLNSDAKAQNSRMNESSSVRSGSDKGHKKRHYKSPAPRFNNPQGILLEHNESQVNIGREEKSKRLQSFNWKTYVRELRRLRYWTRRLGITFLHVLEVVEW